MGLPNTDGELVMTNQLDILVVDKQRNTAVVIDVATPSDCNIRKKEHHKLEKKHTHTYISPI